MEEKFLFEPKPDITAYELASIWAHVQMAVDQVLFDGLPEESKRHFAVKEQADLHKSPVSH